MNRTKGRSLFGFRLVAISDPFAYALALAPAMALALAPSLALELAPCARALVLILAIAL